MHSNEIVVFVQSANFMQLEPENWNEMVHGPCPHLRDSIRSIPSTIVQSS